MQSLGKNEKSNLPPMRLPNYRRPVTLLCLWLGHGDEKNFYGAASQPDFAAARRGHIKRTGCSAH